MPHKKEVTNVHVYTVRSESDALMEYEVMVGDDFFRCTCPHFRYRKVACKHYSRVYDDWFYRRRGEPAATAEPHPFAKLRVPEGVDAILTGPVRADLYREES